MLALVLVHGLVVHLQRTGIAKLERTKLPADGTCNEPQQTIGDYGLNCNFGLRTHSWPDHEQLATALAALAYDAVVSAVVANGNVPGACRE
jgi:hypothetical protein